MLISRQIGIENRNILLSPARTLPQHRASTYMHMCIQVCVCVCANLFAQYVHMRLCAYIHTYIHTYIYLHIMNTYKYVNRYCNVEFQNSTSARPIIRCYGPLIYLLVVSRGIRECNLYSISKYDIFPHSLRTLNSKSHHVFPYSILTTSKFTSGYVKKNQGIRISVF